MKLNQECDAVLRSAHQYTKEHGLAYVTPETILRAMCLNARFAAIVKRLGGTVETLCAWVEEYLQHYIPCGEEGSISFSEGSLQMLHTAELHALSSGRTEVTLAHLFYGLWQQPQSYAVYFLRRQGLDEMDILGALGEGGGVAEPERKERPETRSDAPEQDNHIKGWEQYAPCLNRTADSHNPLIGREEEMERIMQILLRRDKNNPLLLGEPGVGKTAMVYGLVQKILEGSVPDMLKDSQVYMMDLGSMLAGTQFRGEFEKRFKGVLAGIAEQTHPILFVDEIHNLSGAGAIGEGALEASNLLRPYLTEGHIRFIGATTYEEYRRYFEKNKSMVRRFQNVEIKAPSQAETEKILEGLKYRYEQFHGVHYTEDAIPYAVRMSDKYIPERFLPDKAIDLMDEAGAYRRLHPGEAEDSSVGTDILAEVLTHICRVPVETVASEATDGLQTLETRMKARVFGQDEAIDQVVNAIKFSRAGLLEEDKPLASLLFVGPTGVGKTEVAKALSQELGISLVRFDMSEYAEKHTVAKLIGSPAGYVGYEDGGLLTEQIRKHPSCVLLLDEIEKAHPDIYQVLLQVMDYATLTDNQGRKADFRNVVVIMTSNAGASVLGKKEIGFSGSLRNENALMEEVKRVFQPEFRNRLNRIVSFRSMDDAMAEKIVNRKLQEMARMLEKRNVKLNVDDSARAWILEKGISVQYGAREIDRVLRNEVKPLFVDLILFGPLKAGGHLRLWADNGKLLACAGEDR